MKKHEELEGCKEQKSSVLFLIKTRFPSLALLTGRFQQAGTQITMNVNNRPITRCDNSPNFLFMSFMVKTRYA